MICVIDETTPEVNGTIIYTVVSAVMLESESVARAELSAVIAARKRSFHWAKEGPQARAAMAEAATRIGAIAIAFEQSCGRKTQARARDQLLEHAITWAVGNGATHIIIERRSGREDQRDAATVKRTLRTLGLPTDVPQVRRRTKSEPLLWLADAVAGVARERYIPTTHEGPSKQLREAVTLEIVFVPKE